MCLSAMTSRVRGGWTGIELEELYQGCNWAVVSAAVKGIHDDPINVIPSCVGVRSLPLIGTTFTGGTIPHNTQQIRGFVPLECRQGSPAGVRSWLCPMQLLLSLSFLHFPPPSNSTTYSLHAKHDAAIPPFSILKDDMISHPASVL